MASLATQRGLLESWRERKPCRPSLSRPHHLHAAPASAYPGSAQTPMQMTSRTLSNVWFNVSPVGARM